MTLKEFKKQAKITKTNTNNSWGFGGRIVTTYELGFFKYTVGKACYRHFTEPVQAYYYQGVHLTKGLFLKLIKEKFQTEEAF